MKRVFETAECEAVRRSYIFWELKYEKHENRMKGCDVEQKVSPLHAFLAFWLCGKGKGRGRETRYTALLSLITQVTQVRLDWSPAALHTLGSGG